MHWLQRQHTYHENDLKELEAKAAAEDAGVHSSIGYG